MADLVYEVDNMYFLITRNGLIEVISESAGIKLTLLNDNLRPVRSISGLSPDDGYRPTYLDERHYMILGST